MNLSLAGMRILVTGASRGLGREIAQHLVELGASVGLAARGGEELQEVRERLRGYAIDADQTITIHAGDLATREGVAKCAAEFLNEFGGIDVLVNNAAIQGPIGQFVTAPEQEWEQTFEANFHGPIRLTRRLLPSMIKAGRGKIINLSGGGATGPRPDFSAYASAKAALVRWSETLAEELKDSRIDVNCVAPGAMNTRMLDEILAAGPGGAPREYERALEQQANGGTPPRQGAELIGFLASRASDGITGRLLSAVWDDWRTLENRREILDKSDVYTLRRIVPKDRGFDW